MTLLRLLTGSCEVVRYGEAGRDELNRPVRGEVSRIVYPCRLEPTSSDEANDDRTSYSVDSWRIYLPASADISAADVVVSDGTTYEVVGSPARMATPRGTLYVMAQLRVNTEVAP